MREFAAKIFKGDKVIWGCYAILWIISLVEYYSASAGISLRVSPNFTSQVMGQVGYLMLGLMLMLAIIHIIPRTMFRLIAWLGMPIVLILFVLLFSSHGVTQNEATRQVRLFGFSIQVSEIAKVVLVAYISEILPKGDKKMANITAKDVAALRAKTGLGMMDCKKALVEAEGDVEKAVKILREKGLATAEKKAGRVAAEGRVDIMTKNGVTAMALHGNKSQGQRLRALADFKAGRVTVLVATDIAARGIDINELPKVINYDLPQNSEIYVHRIGRTGRAGKEGTAITLFTGLKNEFYAIILT